jgi:hypothetical protein
MRGVDLLGRYVSIIGQTDGERRSVDRADREDQVHAGR